jgi:murein DD-endopeptidase MepM/ murein hydrolase activator NlpD
MSFSSQKRSAPSSNPFEIFGERSATTRKPAPASHRVLQHDRHKATRVQPVIESKSAVIRSSRVNQQRLPFNGLKVFLYLTIFCVITFSLLPMPVQKRFLNGLGLGVISIVRINPPLPVDYDYISSPFGKRWGRQHQGIDFAAPQGASIYAASAGTVIYSGWESGYGKSVVLDHGQGRLTRYAHCSKLLVKVGQVVSKGLQIAEVGSTGHSTGPHLHFEVIVDGVRKNPAWFYSFDANSALEVAQVKRE